VYARSSDRRIRKIIKGLIGRSLDDCLRNRGMTVKKYLQKTGGTSFKQAMLMLVWILVSSTSMTGTGRAECIPTPDCASIGYTESSCDGKFTRCPFDTSKLFCIPCDSSFMYDCLGTNMISGEGNECNGKYVACKCNDNYIFEKGDCKQNCTIGMIYYSDGSCLSNFDSSKTAVGIVVKDNELIVSLTVPRLIWSTSSVDIGGIYNYNAQEMAKNDYAGRANTAAIVASHGESVTNIAGGYCYSYAPIGMENTKRKWYLPALGELNDYIIQNYNQIKNSWDQLGTSLSGSYFWSSSEYDYYHAWDTSSSGFAAGYGKSADSFMVVCLLNIKD